MEDNSVPLKMALSEEAIVASLRQSELQRSIDAKKLSVTTTVPTNRKLVVHYLRQLNQPAILFGESPAETRERLRSIMVAQLSEGKTLDLKKPSDFEPSKEEEKHDSELQSRVYYTKGSPFLRKIRRSILEHSIESAKNRMAKQKTSLSKHFKLKKMATLKRLKNIKSAQSEVGDTRPLSCIAVCPQNLKIATGSWSGCTKVWSLGSMADRKAVKTLRSNSRVTDAKFFPKPTENVNECPLLASCGVDGRLRVWNTSKEEPLVSELKCHSQRLGKMAFLPGLNGLAAVTSFDKTWSLWDLSAERNVMRQSGHTAAVYSVAAHPDCSLCLTGDLSGVARLWDNRSGQAVLNLRGHIGKVLSSAFSPDGIFALTGSDDNSVKVWDLRGKNLFYTVPAHFKAVSSIQFEKENGFYFVTSSFDKTIKLWSSKTFKLLKTLRGHEDRISDCALGRNDLIFSSSFDRTWKKWKEQFDGD